MDEYKVKYEQAIERMMAWVNEGPSGREALAVRIFPELTETEDDRIKRAILIYLDWMDGRNKGYQPKGAYTIRDMIAWLNKQGPMELSEEDENNLNQAMYICHRYDYVEVEKWLRSLRKRFSKKIIWK